ncbi:hypothetical protein ACIFOE_21295 [Paenibacillus sp. NRS-1783]|uniref:hypothetical protein n=1 Tax=Paenibacillus sp. NRS-1783 TaxID=3233907 RepID=UPI003D26D0F0
MNTLEELNRDYDLYVAELSRCNYSQYDLQVSSDSITPEYYLDSMSALEFTSRETAEQFLDQFFSLENTLEILDGYDWEDN